MTTERDYEDTASDRSTWSWVWRGKGPSDRAHLIPLHKADRANPHAMCLRRIRSPRLQWTGVCKDCVTAAADVLQPVETYPAEVMR